MHVYGSWQQLHRLPGTFEVSRLAGGSPFDLARHRADSVCVLGLRADCLIGLIVRSHSGRIVVIFMV